MSHGIPQTALKYIPHEFGIIGTRSRVSIELLIAYRPEYLFPLLILDKSFKKTSELIEWRIRELVKVIIQILSTAPVWTPNPSKCPNQNLLSSKQKAVKVSRPTKCNIEAMVPKMQLSQREIYHWHHWHPQGFLKWHLRQ